MVMNDECFGLEYTAIKLHFFKKQEMKLKKSPRFCRQLRDLYPERFVFQETEGRLI